jgi:alpha-amylase
MKTVQFVIALHNHQPVGNFDHVIESACRMSYEPFLDMLDEFPEIRCVLHYSGPLLEWIQANRPRLSRRIADGAKSDHFELMGGGFSEPILTMLTRADAVGQIQMLRGMLKRRYHSDAAGIWLAERIWEPHLAGVLAEAGVRYTVVDDFHFKVVGLRDDALKGYYTTEDEGRLLNVFNGSEFLRYAIPFGKPEDTVEMLRDSATEDGRNVIVYADDGEKFGTWPETYKHVYENGWLRRFFEALRGNLDWIKLRTFKEVLSDTPSRGRIYLPDASYREMTEWALPPQAQIEFKELLEGLQNCGLSDAARPFIRGGTWRNFKMKYSEAAEMYARMLEAGRNVAERSAAKNYEEARKALYRSQCNCGYWHGVFGGLYMPFLRFTIYEQLLKAEALIATKHERPGTGIADFDLDGQPEVKLHTPKLNAYLRPHAGGVLYELDDREGCRTLTSVLMRRFEAYHKTLQKAVEEGSLQIVGASEEVQTIHGRARAKESGLEKDLHYDRFPRASLMDHFLPADVDPGQLRAGECRELGDFLGAEYELHNPRSRACQVTLRRKAVIGPPDGLRPVELAKRISLSGNSLEARYVLSFPEGAPDDTLFAVEFNIGLMAGDAPDRNFFSGNRENLGNLSTVLRRTDESRLGIIDEWLKLELWFSIEPSAGFWTYPVHTVNESEGGFERVYQGSALLPYWRLKAQPGEEQICTITLEVQRR